MNRLRCEREEQTSAATVSRAIEPEIMAHAQDCRDCSDILLVGEFLQNDSLLTDREQVSLVNPGLIWRKAQQRETQRAIRLALRPIRWMTVLACVAFVCSPWLRLVLPVFQDLGSSSSKFLSSELVTLSRIWPAIPNETMILLVMSGTIILLGLSSWLMLREE